LTWNGQTNIRENSVTPIFSNSDWISDIPNYLLCAWTCMWIERWVDSLHDVDLDANLGEVSKTLCDKDQRSRHYCSASLCGNEPHKYDVTWLKTLRTAESPPKRFGTVWHLGDIFVHVAACSMPSPSHPHFATTGTPRNRKN
jgi:hypothetical protein